MVKLCTITIVSNKPLDKQINNDILREKEIQMAIKRLVVELEPEIHEKLRQKALSLNKTIKDYVTEIIIQKTSK